MIPFFELTLHPTRSSLLFFALSAHSFYKSHLSIKKQTWVSLKLFQPVSSQEKMSTRYVFISACQSNPNLLYSSIPPLSLASLSDSLLTSLSFSHTRSTHSGIRPRPYQQVRYRFLQRHCEFHSTPTLLSLFYKHFFFEAPKSAQFSFGSLLEIKIFFFGDGTSPVLKSTRVSPPSHSSKTFRRIYYLFNSCPIFLLPLSWHLSTHSHSHGFCSLRRSNLQSSSTANAALEAARDAKSPVILQVSQGGAAYFAGKGLPNDKQQASIAGAVAAAHHIRAVAPSYGVPVILHSDHCAKKLLPWFDGE